MSDGGGDGARRASRDGVPKGPSTFNILFVALAIPAFGFAAYSLLLPLDETAAVLSQAALSTAEGLSRYATARRGPSSFAEAQTCGASTASSFSSGSGSSDNGGAGSEMSQAAGTGLDPTVYDQLFDWVWNVSGVEPKLKVGDVCRDEGAGRFCMRGTVASKDIKAGEKIASVPRHGYAVLREATVEAWLGLIHEDPDFNKTFAPWLAVLPAKGEILAPDGMSDEEISLLQGGVLGSRWKWQQSGMIGAYQRAMGVNGSTLVQRLGLSFEDYAHAAMSVNTRYWGFRNESANDPAAAPVLVTMVPLLDMANHAEAFNAYVTSENSSVIMVALQNIKKGDEVSITYQQGKLHRPDMALLNYGFLPKRRPPLLAAYDLGAPEAEQMRKDGGAILTPPTDDDTKLGGRFGTYEEMRRLMNLLASFPTTEAADRKQLAEDKTLNWRQRTLLEFRAERKAALRFVIARLADGFAEWASLLKRMEGKWSKYDDFDFVDRPPHLPPPRVRMDWETALSLLASENSTSAAQSAHANSQTNFNASIGSSLPG